MTRIARVTECIGFLMIMLGGGAMDSASLVGPITMAMIGCALLWTGAKMEELI